MELTPPVEQSSLVARLGAFRENAVNATNYLAPSPMDLLMVFPRIAHRAGSFVTEGIPEAFENLFGGGIAGRVIADATAQRAVKNVSATVNETAATAAAAAAAASAGIASTTAEGGGQPVAMTQGSSGFIQAFSFQQLRTFGGIFSYMTSKWALGCFAAAIILNRTSIYAASRRHLNLNWQIRFFIRLVPIIVLTSTAFSFLRAMRCQTSPQYSAMKYGESGQNAVLDFAEDGNFLYKLSSALLFYESELGSCTAVDMVSWDENPEHARGSMSLLWPAFVSFCTSQFFETLSCALQGRPLATETGMSLFEHSLAFAEAEAMIGSQLAAGSSGAGTDDGSGSLARLVGDHTLGVDGSYNSLKSSIILKFNTPPEVLLMSLISSFNCLSSQILGILGLQGKYRLLNTSIWGMLSMSSFIWGFFTFTADKGIESGIFRFPTVCVVGIIPHTLILVGILLCSFIYVLAVVLTILSPPEGTPLGATWRERLRHAHSNMQASIQLSGLRLNRHEDFYTALLRIGFTALTAASEAVFLNEGRRINVGQWTWLEEDRMNEIIRARSERKLSQGREDPDLDAVASGVAITGADDDSSLLLGKTEWKSGYAKERSTKILKQKPSVMGSRETDGVGAMQRGRYILALGFLLKIFWLLVGWAALCIVKFLDVIGIGRRPSWITRLYEPASGGKTMEARDSETKELEFWILGNDGELRLPANSDVDVEVETKKRLMHTSGTWGPAQETLLDVSLYSWFVHNGWWGEHDSSGEYRSPQNQEDDTTSLISFTSTEGDVQSPTSSLSSGQVTPTQSRPYSSFPRDSTPAVDRALDTEHLARLLNPVDAESRAEARMLAAHLSSSRAMTRSQYSRATDAANTHVLTSTRYRPAGLARSSISTASSKLSPSEEKEVLEHLIVKFRERGSKRDVGGTMTTGWSDGGEGLGAGGPMCVVCQSAPRTILAWPCRCLSLCEECRVSLAMNNFGTCVCCRQDVAGFSRLFVP